MRVESCLSRPRMKTVTDRWGAWSLPLGPGTRPGLMVVKRKLPLSSVGMRPKPRNPRASGLFCLSAECAYLPCAFACQISISPSSTPTPSPSMRRPRMAMRSPFTPGPAMRVVLSHVSPMCGYGPTVCDPIANRLMSLSRRAVHRRGLESAQHDVEAVGEGVLRHRVFPVELGHPPHPGLLVGNAHVHRVVRQQRISGEVHLRDHAREEGAAEKREMDVGGPPGVVVVAPRVFPGPDGDGAAGTREVRVDGGVVLVGLVRVAARGVRLPDLDQRVRHGLAALVEHAAADDDALAERIALVLAREVVVGRLHIAVAEYRAGDLGERLRHDDERLRRVALRRRDVERKIVFGLRARMKPAVALDLGHGGVIVPSLRVGLLAWLRTIECI